MILIRIRNACRGCRYRHIRICLFDARSLNASLDLSNTLEIIVNRISVARSQLLLQIQSLLDEGIENAAILLFARDPLGGIRTLAEHPLENFSRIDLHRQRRGGRTPGE